MKICIVVVTMCFFSVNQALLVPHHQAAGWTVGTDHRRCSSTSSSLSITRLCSQSISKQNELMESDQCMEVNENDVILGKVSKKASHSLSPTTPQGRLHRAFSVFLFDSSNRLLLQQRALSKITFPGVWTNTCCSHPLHCQAEMDDQDSIARGLVPGIKLAAIRKLNDELGVPVDSLSVDDFKFLTRIHYFARDEVTYGREDCPWCEHEIDYILFAKADVKLDPNPDEVGSYRYVTWSELESMLDPATGLLWSPWFRVIAQNFLRPWWVNLEATLLGDTFSDTQTIHRFGDVSLSAKATATAGSLQ